jgi:transcriptional regulator with XRE-family HTH domain
MDVERSITSAKTDTTVAGAARRNLHAAIGERIRGVRIANGLAQAECARNAGIDTSSLFRIEKGGQNLTVETLARVALSIGVGMDELLVGVDPDPAIIEARTRTT